MHAPRLLAIPLIAIAAACGSESTPTAPAAVASAQASFNSSSAAVHQSATVTWHAQQMLSAGTHNSGAVAGATAELVRTANGISYRLSSPSLLPGHAYTLWLVVINNPAACGNVPVCSPQNIIQNPLTRSQVRWAAGTVVGESGFGTFAGAVQEGELSGWLPNRSLENSRTADIHLVINDHGPMLSAYMPGMIHTYRGGCSNSSPFPGVFPATALADGEPGPNTCLLYQAAVFPAPAQ
jgi:hypothetical protein